MNTMKTFLRIANLIMAIINLMLAILIGTQRVPMPSLHSITTNYILLTILFVSNSMSFKTK